MRLELNAASEGGSVPLPAPALPRASRDVVELGALVLFGLLSVWVLALDLYQVAAHGQVWTGTDGVYITDQMQYLAWIRDTAHHGLASNLFVLRSTSPDYFQPAVEISAVLTALGVAPWLSLLMWKPVAVICLFLAFRAYVHRSLASVAARRTALVLALFFGSFTLLYGSWTVVGDLMPGFLSWGYEFGVLAMALMVFALLGYVRAREGRRVSLWPGVLGAIASLLHPWQGELMILILCGAELIVWRTEQGSVWQRLRLLAVTVVIVGVALLYYELLGRFDESWRLARVASKHTFPFWPVLLALTPLIVPALFAWRPRRLTFTAAITRVWPLAALLIWVLSASALSATPLHAVQGLTLPLAVLAVEGASRLRLQRLPAARVWLVAAVFVLTVPGTLKLLDVGKTLAAPTLNNPNFISHDERRALRYLARSPERGGVLSRMYLGTVVPGLTGRRVFVGDCLWSEPHCYTRITVAQALFQGALTTPQARSFVRATGARFVLSDCQQPSELTHALGSLVISVHRFGCAVVYELDAPSPASGPLSLDGAGAKLMAQSAPDAAVRASRRQ
jgi:hypothetical protein